LRPNSAPHPAGQASTCVGRLNSTAATRPCHRCSRSLAAGGVPRETKADRVPDQLKLSTYNARSERMARAFSFGAAWRGAQRCIVPARAIYEPDWRSGKSVRTRFTASNGRLLNIAGLWSNWEDADGVWSGSYTMITLSAKDHELFKNYHRPEKEKRMVAFLHDHECEAWLDAPVEKAMEFIKGYPPDLLVATPAPRLTKLKKVPRKSEAVPEPASDQLDLLQLATAAARRISSWNVAYAAGPAHEIETRLSPCIRTASGASIFQAIAFVLGRGGRRIVCAGKARHQIQPVAFSPGEAKPTGQKVACHYIEMTACDDVVRHLVPGFFSTRFTSVRRMKADPFHLPAPFFVVITTAARLAEVGLPDVRHFVSERR
jgi:putative SOS response-associated peptidase YedK